MKHVAYRSSGDYDIIEKAKELAGYTLRITSNEKNFPKRYRYSVVNKIQEKILDILDNLVMAYELYPNSKTEFDKRILHQKEARAGLRSLMLMIEVAANTFDIKASTFAFWTDTTVELKDHVSGWIKADVKRFEKYRGAD